MIGGVDVRETKFLKISIGKTIKHLS